MRILAIDLGKNNSVACDYEAPSDQHGFISMATTPARLSDIITKVAPDRVVIEISSQAGWVGDLVRGMGIELQVANPNQEGWRWNKVKRKTDRDDALKLARLSAMNQLPLVYLPERNIRQWRSLIQYRQSLVASRTAVKNRIRSILDREAIKMPAGKSGWSRIRILSLQELARPLGQVSIDDLWRGELHEELDRLECLDASVKRVETKLEALAASDERVKLLQSIPGVGPRLAEMVVSVIDDPHRFGTGKQLGCYVGLTPRQYQSGSMDRQGRISSQGHKDLRKLLVEVSWLGLRHNRRMREIYERVRRGSKVRKKIAIVAVARRLLIWCWAMLRDDQPWDATQHDADRSGLDQAA
jgi:transposase